MVCVIERPYTCSPGIIHVLVAPEEIRLRKVVHPKILVDIFRLNKRDSHKFLIECYENFNDGGLGRGVDDAVDDPPFFAVQKRCLVLQYKFKIGKSLAETVAGR